MMAFEMMQDSEKTERTIQYADREKALEVARRLAEERAELMKKLADS